MKTVVSIPDDLLANVKRFARRTHRTRSEVFTAALREYVARHCPEDVTEAVNKALDGVEQRDEFVTAAARRVLEKTEW